MSLKLTARETAVFGMLGAVMYASKAAMEALPNIHPLGMLITAITIVYREKALYPIYIYILLNGLFTGFPLWWVPYLYVWLVLWGMVMLLPRELPKMRQAMVYMLVCAAHGLLFGILYAPAQALLFGLNWRAMVSWIVAGLPFDLIHGVSNFCLGVLIMPTVSAIRLAQRSFR